MSPCNKVCRIDRTLKLCQGCWRTIEEITLWRRLSDDEKRQIMKRLENRKRRFAPH
ncbi:MAG: DUF1289 domain-containing protein [Calditrichaeota bacterium]|nr:MAG: DUF1289 domain-containing protein [Calditrichota bacterium]